MAAISGRLIQKIARQEIVSISAPPPAGPSTVAIPVQAVQVPTAFPARRALEGRGDDRERPRHQERAGDPLQSPGPDQESGARSDRAERRRHAESRQPDHVDPTPPELVAQRAADEEQRDERERVGLDDPLLAGEAGVEVAGNRGQRDVDHRRVEKDHRRAENRRDQCQQLLT